MIKKAAWLAGLLVAVLMARVHASSPVDQMMAQPCWSSDKEATVQWFSKHRPKALLHERFISIYGLLKIRMLWPDQWISYFQGEVKESTFRLLGKTDQQLAIQEYSGLWNKTVIWVIDVDADGKGYWVYEPTFDIKEHFKAVDCRQLPKWPR